MSQVKVQWVEQAALLTKGESEGLHRIVPVVELTSLAEVVEGLKKIQKLAKQDHTGPLDPFGDLIRIENYANDLLAQFEGHTT